MKAYDGQARLAWTSARAVAEETDVPIARDEAAWRTGPFRITTARVTATSSCSPNRCRGPQADRPIVGPDDWALKSPICLWTRLRRFRSDVVCDNLNTLTPRCVLRPSRQVARALSSGSTSTTRPSTAVGLKAYRRCNAVCLPPCPGRPPHRRTHCALLQSTEIGILGREDRTPKQRAVAWHSNLTTPDEIEAVCTQIKSGLRQP